MKDTDLRYAVDALLFVVLLGMAAIGVLLGFVIKEGPFSSGADKFFLGLHRHQWGSFHAYLSIAFVVLMVVHLILSWKWIRAKTKQIFGKGSTPVLVSIACLPLGVLFVFWTITPKNSEVYLSYGAGARMLSRISQAGPAAVLPEAERAAEKPVGSPPSGTAPREKERPLESPPPETAPEIRPAPPPAHESTHAELESLSITGQQTLHDVEVATGISARAIIARWGIPPDIPVNVPLGRLRRQHGFQMDDLRNIVAALLKEKEKGRMSSREEPPARGR